MKSKPKWPARSEQLRGCKLIMQGGARLFLPPGKGKTSTVLKSFKVLKKLGFVDALLVLAPLRVVTTSWPQDIEKWEDFDDLTHTLIHGGKDGRLSAMRKDVDVYLMNVEGLLTSEWKLGRGNSLNPVALKFLKGKRFMLAVDESTKFKNSQSSRFKTLKRYLPHMDRVVVMTGTPKPNTLEDLFSQCYLTDQGDDLGQFITHFRNEYMELGYDGQWHPQKTAMARVAEKIAPTTLQLEDSEAMPLEVIDYWLPMPECIKEQYEELKKEFITQIQDKTVLAPNEGVLLLRLRQMAQGAIWIAGETDYTELHEAKQDALEGILEELNGDPLFCMYQFRHDYMRLEKRLGHTVPRIGSGVSAQQGAAWCRAFGAGHMPLLLGHPQSVAHGVDGLQNNCNNVLWLGLDWSWENYYQANRRVARHGSKADKVFIRRIMIDCPTERAMLASVEGKKTREAEFLQILRSHLLP